MRFHLEGDGPAVADVDDAGVFADTGQHACAHLVGRGLTEIAQVHLRGLVGAVLTPHHRVHRQLGIGGPTAQNFSNSLVLVVFETQLAEWLRLFGGARRVLDSVNQLGARARHATQSKVRGGS